MPTDTTAAPETKDSHKSPEPPFVIEAGHPMAAFVDAIPNPPNPLKDVAFHALSHAYSIGYLVCGIAALVAAVIAAVFLGGRAHRDTFLEDPAAVS